MDTEPKKIETMDDLRAAMNAPEIKAANREFSKKYLKANRPKSLMVVIVGIVALFLLISFSNHKASSVTPVALRTAERVEVASADGSGRLTLSGQQREDLIALLGTVKVQRTAGETDGYLDADHLFFTFDGDESGDWFAIDAAGNLYTEDNCYELASGEADALWTQLTAICGAASN